MDANTGLGAALQEWLRDGPLPIGELIRRGQAAGVLPEDDEDALDDVDAYVDMSPGYWPFDHGPGDDASDEDLWVAAESAFADNGLVVTHRLTDAEVTAGAVAHDTDLTALLPDAVNQRLTLATGGELRSTVDTDAGDGVDSDRLIGPDGWLDGFGPGDLVAFRRAHGVATLSLVAEPGDDQRELDALRTMVARFIPDGSGEEASILVTEALARDASLFREPVRPVRELFADLGLAPRGVEWGRAGTRRTTRAEALTGGRDVHRVAWGLDRCCERAVDLVLAALPVPDAERDHQALADALGHGAVFAALPDEADVDLDALGSLAAAVRTTTTGSSSAGVIALQAMLALRNGEPNEALALFRTALDADDGLETARDLLAELLIDAGDLAGAQRVVDHRDFVGEAPALVESIVRARRKRRVTVGRNEPCPCGSGRKFKQCHGRANAEPETPALRDRMVEVLLRLAHYTRNPRFARDRVRADSLLTRGSGPETTRSLRRSLFVTDVLLFEDGAAAEFLRERGAILPADERAAIDALVAAERRLWLVVDVTADEVTVQDPRTDDAYRVPREPFPGNIEPGDVVLGRIAITADGAFTSTSLVEVEPEEVDEIGAIAGIDGHERTFRLLVWFRSHVARREGEAEGGYDGYEDDEFDLDDFDFDLDDEDDGPAPRFSL